MATADIDGYLVKAQQEYVYSLETGFIDADAHPDASLVPELVVNNEILATNVHSTLLKELAGCERFDFSVAFVSCEGVEILTEAFSRLAERGIPGRILTTTYLDFNDPDAIDAFFRRNRRRSYKDLIPTSAETKVPVTTAPAVA